MIKYYTRTLYILVHKSTENHVSLETQFAADQNWKVMGKKDKYNTDWPGLETL